MTNTAQKTILYILYLICIGALIYAVYIAFHPLSTPTISTSPGKSQTQNPVGLSLGSGTNLHLSIPSSKSPSTTAPSSSSSNANSSASSSSVSSAATSTADLANTGPGNVIALFVGSTVVGTLIYRHKLKHDMLR
jgi:hypothetical protein